MTLLKTHRCVCVSICWRLRRCNIHFNPSSPLLITLMIQTLQMEWNKIKFYDILISLAISICLAIQMALEGSWGSLVKQNDKNSIGDLERAFLNWVICLVTTKTWVHSQGPGLWTNQGMVADTVIPALGSGVRRFLIVTAQLVSSTWSAPGQWEIPPQKGNEPRSCPLASKHIAF